MPKKYSYELTLFPQEKSDNGEWSSGTLSILVRESGGDRALAIVSMTFDMRGNTPLGVYGFDVSIQASHAVSFERSVKMGRRLIGAVKVSHDRDIMAFLKKVAVEVVYDSREGGLIPISDVKSSKYHRYFDDHEELGEQWPKFSTVANNLLDAKLDIVKQAVSAAQTEWAANFLAHEMPITPCRYTSMPNATPAIERLKEAGLLIEESP